MSLLLNNPAVRVTQVGILAAPVAPSGLIFPGAGILSGAQTYYVFACIDGAFRLHSSSSPTTIVSPGSPSAIQVSWSPVTGARWYYLFRGLTCVYAGENAFFFDDGRGYAFSPGVPFGAVTTFLINMAPRSTGAGPHPAWNDRRKCRIDMVEDRDLSDPDGYKSVRRELLAKEYGVRRVIRMTFQVDPGSQEDNDLVAIYGAKLGFPDFSSGGIGATVELSMNYRDLGGGNSAGQFRPVRIFGDIRRAPAPMGGKNVLNVYSWDFHVIQPLPSVQRLLALDGTSFW